MPYPGLPQQVADRGIDLALLPINGLGKGVAGNFTFQEPAELCRAAGIPSMVPYHFGMFAFNTVDRDEVATLAKSTIYPRYLLPGAGRYLLFNPADRVA